MNFAKSQSYSFTMLTWKNFKVYGRFFVQVDIPANKSLEKYVWGFEDLFSRCDSQTTCASFLQEEAPCFSPRSIATDFGYLHAQDLNWKKKEKNRRWLFTQLVQFHNTGRGQEFPVVNLLIDYAWTIITMLKGQQICQLFVAISVTFDEISAR